MKRGDIIKIPNNTTCTINCLFDCLKSVVSDITHKLGLQKTRRQRSLNMYFDRKTFYSGLACILHGDTLPNHWSFEGGSPALGHALEGSPVYPERPREDLSKGRGQNRRAQGPSLTNLYSLSNPFVLFLHNGLWLNVLCYFWGSEQSSTYILSRRKFIYP